MTNEKFLEKMNGLVKALDGCRDNYGKIEFDGSSVGENLKKYTTKELQNFPIRTAEIEIATIIAEIQQEIRETENKKRGGKNGAAKIKALNNILKVAPEAKPILKYASIQQVNEKTMQVFCSGYHAVALSETNMIETEQIPKSMEGYEPFPIQQAIPTSGIIGTYKINTNALKALYKSKSAEWKAHRGKYDPKSPCIKWNDKIGFKMNFLLDCVDALGGENIIMENRGDLTAKVLRNDNGSIGLVLPIRINPKKAKDFVPNPHMWAMDSEIDGIFEEIK